MSTAPPKIDTTPRHKDTAPCLSCDLTAAFDGWCLKHAPLGPYPKGSTVDNVIICVECRSKTVSFSVNGIYTISRPDMCSFCFLHQMRGETLDDDRRAVLARDAAGK